jgi:cell division protein FtsW
MARLRTDWILFFTILVMVCFGLVMVYSSSSAVAELHYHVEPYHFILRQLGWAAFSLIVLMYFKRMDYRRLNTPACAFSGLGLVLGALVLVYFADPRAHRWFTVSGIGSVQPSEFAKPALILFLAYFLARRSQVINQRRTLLQAFLAVAMLAFIVVVADLGTAIVPVITTFVVLWVAGLEKRIMVRVLLVGAALVGVAVVKKPLRLGRVIGFVDPKYTLIGKLDTHGRIKA